MPSRAPLKGTDILRRESDQLLTTMVDGELIALSIENGACYGLDAIGTRIWDLLADPRSLDSLCEQLTREFEVDAAVCRQEAVGFLERLRAEGIVSASGAG